VLPRLSWLSEMVGEESEQLRRTFNSVAERYDAIRPAYPRQAIEDLAAVAGLGEHSSILEIGCGTGQLTVALAALGVTVTAIELGDALAGVARRNLARFPAARVLTGAFEDMPVPDQGYDLVVAATAFHWLDRATRVDRCARMLRPGGWLAVIDTEHVAAGTVDFFHAAQTCYETWDPATPPGLRLKPVDEIPAARPELDDAPAFGPVELRRYTWETTYTTAQYCELLLTYSGHLALADDRREGLLACISDLADRKFGGRVTKGYLTELRLTRHI
jgi:ubiquinone/menaquinone biosynthesis C-methylase UbiE